MGVLSSSADLGGAPLSILKQCIEQLAQRLAHNAYLQSGAPPMMENDAPFRFQ
jgi:hypothetical protein